MQTALERKPGNTIVLTMTLPWSTVKASYDKIFEELLKEIEVAGFRKGKAPREMATKQIDRSKVYEEVIRELLPKVYSDAITEQKILPIMHPQIDVLEAEENKDWKVRATTCEKPEITLGSYKEAVLKLKTDKKGKIWVPGEDKKEEKPQEPTVGEVLDALYTEVKVDISPMMVEHEVNRMLSNLVNETQKLGMTIEQYLQAQGKNQEVVRAEYTEQAKKSLSLEFALEEIAELEKVVVEEKEVDSVIGGAKTEEEKKALAERKYYITSLLRRQKTIGKLLESSVLKV